MRKLIYYKLDLDYHDNPKEYFESLPKEVQDALVAEWEQEQSEYNDGQIT